jgi:radical SAM protein with 4Fe4S-binding SPASM domain
LRRATKVPNTVFINLTSKCQLNCIYCSRESINKQNVHMDSMKLFQLLEELLKKKVFKVILTGGEPLLHPDFYNTINVLSGKVAISVLSNGMEICRDTAKFLWLKKVNSVCISLDAPNKMLAEKTRGINSFDSALNAVEHLLREKVPVYLNAVLTKINADIVEDYIKFCSAIGVNHLSFTGVKNIGAASKTFNELELDLDQKKDFYHSLKSARVLGKEKGINVSWNEETWGDIVFSTAKGSDGPVNDLLPCSAGIEQCAITVDGKLLPCNYFHDYICGDVFKNGLEDVWRNSYKLLNLRNISNIPVTEIPMCSTCNKVYVCSGGCRASAFSSFGNTVSPDPICWYFSERNSILSRS